MTKGRTVQSQPSHQAISDYIHYYNYGRYQKKLNCMTPMEYHEYLSEAA